MGAVYKALQPDMNRMVAIKVLHPRLADRKDIASRFRREARAMSHLTHPNTARVFLFDELDDGTLFIIMELLEGKTVNRVVRAEGPMALERALTILVQVCGALEEAHRAGIVHRDLKPENIFLCRQGGLSDFPKVLDFGLAKVTRREMQPGSVQLTREGMVFGTPEFMSPEQAQGLALTPASDVYSLAVILYEMLTGKLPFEAKASLDFLQMHVSAPPIPINERIEGLQFPNDLWPVMARALSKRPQERYESAESLGQDLEAVLDRFRATPVTELPPLSRAPTPVPSTPPKRQTPVPAAPAPLAAWLTGGGIGFVLGFALAWLLMRR